MKYTIQSLTYCIAAVALSVLSGCGKSGTLPSKKNGGTTSTIMYPATSTLTQTGGTPITTTYTYDSDNNLVKFGSDGNYEIDITPHIVTKSYFNSEFDVVNTYSYSGPSNTPVDIYTNTPAQMSISMYTKNVLAGTSTTTPGKLWAFEGTSDKITKMVTSDQGGYNNDFTYDSNGNLKTVAFINLSGVQAGLPYNLMTVTAVDNHPSPFSAVKGYNVISYPQTYMPDFAQAFCKNNPTQILLKRYDPNKGDLEPNEQDDFTYTYNAQGYPTSIIVNITYLGATPSHFVETYTFTYK